MKRCSREAIKVHVEICHLLVNLCIFGNLIIGTLNTNSRITNSRSRFASHATNDVAFKKTQGPIERPTNIIIINDFLEWVLVFNVFVAFTRFALV